MKFSARYNGGFKVGNTDNLIQWIYEIKYAKQAYSTGKI